MPYLKRRDFIMLVGGATAAWPLSARAQQSLPVIGFLHAGSPGERVHLITALREGLRARGYLEGENVIIDYRWAEDQFDRLPALAAELVRRRASVIATPAGTVAALAAKKATTTIPIIFGSENDPLKAGLVASFNPVGQRIEVLHATSGRDIDAAFTSLAQKRASALVLGPGPLFFTRRVQLVTLATRHAIPAIYGSREFAQAGGLMSYGSDLAEVWRQVGDYVGRVLKGAKPSDLPVMQSTKLEFVINLQTARAFDLEIPPTLLARADEVIE